MRALFEPFDISNCFTDLKEVDRVENERQTVLLFHHPRFGKILTIDDEVQHVEAWVEFYHEPLIHLPIAFMEELSSVLILGGGSLFAARECLKYSQIQDVTLVDWDMETINLIERNYDHAKLVLSDQRLVHVCEDAYHFVKTTERKFDLIVNDCFDLSVVADCNVYELLQNRLTENGLCCDVLYRDLFHTETMRRSINDIRKTQYYNYSLIFIPEYPGVLHVLAVWGHNRIILEDFDKAVNPEQYDMFFNYYEPRRLSYFRYKPNKIKMWLDSITGNSF